MISDIIRTCKVSFTFSFPGNAVYSCSDEMASLVDDQPLKVTSRSPLAGDKQRNSSFPRHVENSVSEKRVWPKYLWKAVRCNWEGLCQGSSERSLMAMY